MVVLVVDLSRAGVVPLAPVAVALSGTEASLVGLWRPVSDPLHSLWACVDGEPCMSESLEQVIVDEIENAAILEHNGHVNDGAIIRRICERVSNATADYREFINEADAMLRSGRTREWLRNRFGEWEREGLARWNPNKPRERQYRRMIVPRRVNLEAVRSDAVREAKRDSAA